MTENSLREDRLTRIREGDDVAVESFVRAYQGRIYTYARSVVQDTGDAEEITQDVLLRAIRAIRSRYSPEQLSGLVEIPWLLRITRNLALNCIRARRSRPMVTHGADIELVGDQQPDGLGTAIDDPLRSALQRISATDREWLTLRFVQELSYAEIGMLRGETEAACRGKVFRAVARLRKEYGGSQPC